MILVRDLDWATSGFVMASFASLILNWKNLLSKLMGFLLVGCLEDVSFVSVSRVRN